MSKNPEELGDFLVGETHFGCSPTSQYPCILSLPTLWPSIQHVYYIYHVEYTAVVYAGQGPCG